MKNYYATGNAGGRTSIYAFTSKTKRDDFVACAKGYGQISKIKRDDARRYGRIVHLEKDDQAAANAYVEK